MAASRDSEPPRVLQESVLAYIGKHPDRPVKTRALARELRVPDADYSMFRHLVRSLLDRGELVLGPGRTLRLPDRTHRLVGTFRSGQRGAGFVQFPDRPSLHVARQHRHSARDGDTVVVRVLAPRHKAAMQRGEVVDLVERPPLRWVGILEHLHGHAVVRPHGRGPLPLVHIDDPTAHGARPGDMVVIEPSDTRRQRDSRGAIVECLGNADDARVRVRGVLRRFELPERFPPRVLAAARRAAARFDPHRLDSREDLRDLPTVTVDPPDARDFDDAISLEPLAADGFRLGVHIADVAHFVPLGGPVDMEARRRGTSVYLPGQVVPMLPEPLSTDVCSLQPKQPRLTKSVLLTYDRDANVVETRFANTIIRSDARLSYQEVHAALGRGQSGLPPDILTLLRNARRLAERIRRRRLRNGMLVLTLPEIDVELDERGHVVYAGPVETSFANTIIEMFMVEANEAVARAFTRAGLPHLRRIHPPPDPSGAESVAGLAPALGQGPPTRLNRATIARMLEKARGSDAEPAVNLVLLRALAQASYSPADQGHFALASDEYAHFTSPIRRYPDLTAHRLLEALMRARSGRLRERDRAAILAEPELAEVGRKSSSAERRAQQAEREAINSIMLLVMKGRIGTVTEGMVTAVNPRGAWVQLRPSLAEGFLHVREFGPDHWRYDRRSVALVGSQTGRMVYIGCPVRVRIADVDEGWQTIELVPAGNGPVGEKASPASAITRPRRGRHRRNRRS